MYLSLYYFIKTWSVLKSSSVPFILQNTFWTRNRSQYGSKMDCLYCKWCISLTRLCVCSTWQCVWKETDRTISLQLSISDVGNGGVFRIATRTGWRAVVLYVTIHKHRVWLASGWAVWYAPYQRWVLCTRPHAIGWCPHRKRLVWTLPQRAEGRVQIPPVWHTIHL